MTMHAAHPAHPVEDVPGADDAAANPNHLPVEPDFGQALPPAEPEAPGAVRPPV